MILPQAFDASIVRLRKEESVQMSISRGGNIQLGRRTSFETPVYVERTLIHYNQAKDLLAFLDSVGKSTPFDVQLQVLASSTGNINTQLYVRTQEAPGSKTLLLDGAPNNVTNIVKPYDMFNVSGHSKAYFVGVNMAGSTILPFNSNGSGQVDLSLSQPLIKSVADNETVNFLTPKITVVRTSDVEVTVSKSRSNFVSVSFESVEFI